MSDKYELGTLVIETTRRCNLACKHCLRGNAEPADFNMNTLADLLDHVDNIANVTFSGGEPSLNVPIIHQFLQMVKDRGINVNSFYIATNGIENQEALAIATLRLYEICDEKDDCGISISVDPFHDKNRVDNIVKGLNFYSADKDRSYSRDNNWILKMGRAEDNNLGQPPVWEPDEFELTAWEQDGEVSYYIDTIYLSCNGWAYPSCNLNYQKMDQLTAITPNDPAKAFPIKAFIENITKLTQNLT